MHVQQKGITLSDVTLSLRDWLALPWREERTQQRVMLCRTFAAAFIISRRDENLRGKLNIEVHVPRINRSAHTVVDLIAWKDKRGDFEGGRTPDTLTNVHQG